ncbi:MAG: fructose-6-phosphate aldolase, partial [Armatimonadetes bacterium]|nr:fructose-6-phosphate aldolase [Armatimonadota bacterium]
KIFLDTAVLDEIREVAAWGILDGVTTNPTLAAKAGRPFEENIKQISEIVGPRGTVSAETVSLDAEGMVREARLVCSWADNIVAKVPFGAEGLKAVRILADEGIRTNVTLVFSAVQGLLAMKAGAFYVSPFVGRLDDGGQNGMELVEQLVGIKHHYGFATAILAASLRTSLHIVDAALAGADIATLPYAVLVKSLGHSLSREGLQSFLDDWAKIPQDMRPY